MKWQPIETKPENSSKDILLYGENQDGEEKMVVVYYSFTDTMCHSFSGSFVNDEFDDDAAHFEPTHWMELPDAPKTETP